MIWSHERLGAYSEEAYSRLQSERIDSRPRVTQQADKLAALSDLASHGE